MMYSLSTKKTLNLTIVKDIAAAAEREARASGWNVAIAIVDDAGRLMYFQRMDNCASASVDVAIGKAVHAVNYRRDTKFHQELLCNGNNAVLGLPGIVPIEGGMMLQSDGQLLGAIGVSGVQADQDGQIAKAGVDVLGK